MKNLSILILAFSLAVSLTALTSCTTPQTKGSDLSDTAATADVTGDTSAEQTNATEQTKLESTAKTAASSAQSETSSQSASSSQSATSGQTETAPRIYRPDELLTAEEATSMVGYTVTLEEGSLYTSTDLGYISERYVYDIPSEGSTSTTTIHALVQITQNGLISADSLKEGHDAKWNFDSEKEFSADEISSIPGLGEDAFYFTGTSQVHVLFQDYYIIIAFEKDPYDAANNVDVNKAIAELIVGALSLAPLTD